MKRREKDNRKYPPTNRPSPHLSDFPEKDFQLQNKTINEDIREQLRSTLQQLQHHRLTSDLQVQKRLLLQQQLRNVRQENDQNKIQLEELRRQLSKISKKYLKMKDKKDCEKCKNNEDLSIKLQKERQIYSNDRKIMQDQIKSLRIQLDSSEISQERDRLQVLVDSLYKEVQLSSRKIEQQNRIIRFLNDKLSQFEVENIQIIKNIDTLQLKLSEMEIQSLVHRKPTNQKLKERNKRKEENNHQKMSRSRQRRNGSIQNLKKTEKDDYQSQLERYEH